MVDKTNPFSIEPGRPVTIKTAGAGNQIHGSDRKGTIDNRAQQNLDDRDRVEISGKSRQRLEANTATASNEAVATSLRPIQSTTRLETNNGRSFDGPSQTTPDHSSSFLLGYLA